MNAPSEDIKDILEAESSLGLAYAVNLFRGLEPSTPDNCVTIFDTPGMPVMVTLDSNSQATHYERPSVQIRVRNKKQSDAWTIAHGIVNCLHGIAGETWNDAFYTVIYCSSGPALLDWDTNNRIRLIINFNLQRR